MTNTPSPTDEVRELIANLRERSQPQTWRHIEDKRAMAAAADRLESLLADRAKLQEALRMIASGNVDGDPAEPFSGYMRCRKLALVALNRSTDRAT